MITDQLGKKGEQIERTKKTTTSKTEYKLEWKRAKESVNQTKIKMSEWETREEIEGRNPDFHILFSSASF